MGGENKLRDGARYKNKEKRPQESLADTTDCRALPAAADERKIKTARPQHDLHFPLASSFLSRRRKRHTQKKRSLLQHCILFFLFKTKYKSLVRSARKISSRSASSRSDTNTTLSEESSAPLMRRGRRSTPSSVDRGHLFYFLFFFLLVEFQQPLTLLLLLLLLLFASSSARFTDDKV